MINRFSVPLLETSTIDLANVASNLSLIHI